MNQLSVEILTVREKQSPLFLLIFSNSTTKCPILLTTSDSYVRDYKNGLKIMVVDDYDNHDWVIGIHSDTGLQ